ncbi:MAG: isoprenylcysteine carboxylmethyltransferase family protein [Actinomycetota bacterium]
MRRRAAAIGSAVFFVAAPGTAAGLAPWLLSRWRAGGSAMPALRILGGLLIAAGALVLVTAFARFVAEGTGTPSPTAPTEQLVVGGLYRYVRNPMYLAVLAVVLGQALLLGRPILLGYALGLWAAFAAFVRGYEEPTLRRRYGEAYDAYRSRVPAWIPRAPSRTSAP